MGILRVEEPLPTTTDQANRETTSPDVSVGLSPHAAVNDDTNANSDPVTDTQPKAGATRRWTLEEDAKLTRAVANISKKKWGKEYKTDWPDISAMVPGRTRTQCLHRWYDALDPSIGRAGGRQGKWTEIEDSKLKDAVQTHGGKDWATIAALVPARSKKQCYQRWQDVFDPNIERASVRSGKWTAVEDIKLKDAVQNHGGKNWDAIAALVPGRTKLQCRVRWHGALVSNIDPMTARAGKWIADEDIKLKDAVQTHGGKDWAAIAALVPGRTKIQCCNRWHNDLDHSIDRANGRTDKSTSDEHIKLKDAVQTHGGKNGATLAALVPDRTKN
jgi:hypothetical protein